ncbi:MAG TPA: hypothetical protein VGQ83_04045 [Polyangia bacterium]|jgi:hypothetical protein
MRRLSLLAVLALLAVSCGSESSSGGVASFFPADNEVAGWTEDTTLGQPGVEVFATKATAEGVIDGDVEPFAAVGFTSFARNYYVNAAYKIELRVWDMGTATKNTALYDDLVASDPLYSANTWEAQSIGDAGRIADLGSNWWVNARKGQYYVEVKINQTSSGDAAARADGIAFLTAVVAKI